jgi:hypothetical protein
MPESPDYFRERVPVMAQHGYRMTPPPAASEQ